MNERFPFDGFIVDGHFGEVNVYLSGGDRIHDFGRRSRIQIDADIGSPADKRGYELRYKFDCGDGHTGKNRPD